ncbi:D-amino-acid oxidase [Skermanella aerolata]|uniref:D-amino-acid oxidase n=1 Tax=Skermanella aerolata TaxID=393310 RepID=A0A512DPG2_9PROT|nr:FAD-binding oxidoreductase [Skermanella aerolata]KJB95670.1 D-amino acid oxidase [Skermanella aerolata KACC 11604]GEO38356.1 D-amino-acid oxidase [Skermanella aerolata]
MAPRIDQIETDQVIPKRVDVVIIGGGIVGVCTAMFLAEKGVSVALCEKGHIAGEQSSRNWGWCRKMGRDVAEIPLAIESLRFWEQMNTRVEGETGFRKEGVVYLCETQDDIARHEEWLEHARPYQLDSHLLSPDAVDKLLPGSARKWKGALYTPSDGRAEPQKAAPAIAAAARRMGAYILTGCAVRGIETSAGKVSGAVTEKGTIACDTVVVAGGAWSRLFLGNIGVTFPQLKILGSVMRTKPLDGVPSQAVGASDFAFRRRLDGGYTVAQRGANVAPIVPDSFRLFFDFLPALRKQWHELRLRVNGRFIEEWQIPKRWTLDQKTPFETVRVLDPAPVDSILEEAKVNLARNFPAFRNMEIVESWGGLVDVMPDAVPVISHVPGVPGLVIASGMSGHGFGLGPGTGRMAADLVTGDVPIADPTPFRYERFLRGTTKAA